VEAIGCHNGAEDGPVCYMGGDCSCGHSNERISGVENAVVSETACCWQVFAGHVHAEHVLAVGLDDVWKRNPRDEHVEVLKISAAMPIDVSVYMAMLGMYSRRRGLFEVGQDELPVWLLLACIWSIQMCK
jgi:hypothetical protein